jgi:WD40 repeat protein
VAVSPDGAEVIVGGRATSVARWKVEDGSVRWVSLPDGVVKAVSWGPDGPRATVSGANATFQLTAAGPAPDPLRATAYRRLVALPGGALVGLPYAGAPLLWEGAGPLGEELAGVPEGSDIGVGPSGAALLDVMGGVWALEAGPTRVTRRGTVSDARAVDAGPEGRSVLAATDRLLVLGTSGETLLEWPLEGRTVLDVAWSPDGGWIATGNLDGTADLWRASDGALLATLAGHQDRVVAVEFAPDSSWLVTGSWDHSARRWSLAPLRSPPSPSEAEARWGASLDATLSGGAFGLTGSSADGTVPATVPAP